MEYQFSIIRRYVLFVLFFIRVPSFAQEMDLSSYLSNVVDIGGGNFGIITGQIDENTISFVTIGDIDEHFYNGISVKFHGSDYESTAYLIKTFNVGDFKIVLYQSGKPDRFRWRSDHYDYLSPQTDAFRTFLDNGMSDNRWSNLREPISLVTLTNKVAVLQMKNQFPYNRGMPVFNGHGSIVGAISSKTRDEGLAAFQAIDFAVVEDLLYQFGKCKYFQLIRFGQRTTICEVEERDDFRKKRNETKLTRQNKKYNFTAAPAFGPAVAIFPSDIDYYSLGGFGINAGINFYLWPDGSTRVSVKPRYALYEVSLDERRTIKVGNTEFIGTVLKSFEIPIMAEFVATYHKEGNAIVAIGYAPAFHYGTGLIFHIDERRLLTPMDPVSTVFHNIRAEITFENRISRWGFFYATQLNRWLDSDFELRIEKEVILPFEGQKSVAHYFGAEFSWRLWGNWLLKEK